MGVVEDIGHKGTNYTMAITGVVGACNSDYNELQKTKRIKTQKKFSASLDKDMHVVYTDRGPEIARVTDADLLLQYWLKLTACSMLHLAEYDRGSKPLGKCNQLCVDRNALGQQPKRGETASWRPVQQGFPIQAGSRSMQPVWYPFLHLLQKSMFSAFWSFMSQGRSFGYVTQASIRGTEA